MSTGHPFLPMPRHNNDILGKLKRATSEGEIAALLAELAMFMGASDGTVRKAKRLATRRREELEDLK